MKIGEVGYLVFSDSVRAGDDKRLKVFSFSSAAASKRKEIKACSEDNAIWGL